jgi:protein TonB
MSITYPDWNSGPDADAPRTGMGALLEERLRPHQRTLRERLPSIAVSILAHGAIAYVIVFAGLTVIKPKEEVQTINVSIAPEIAQPTPPPKLERMPDVVQPKVSQIAPPMLEIAAPPSQMTIQAAPPSPPVLLPEKASEEAAPITPPRFDAAYLNNPGPAYPNMSRRLREIGTVQLRVRVSVTGQPLEIQMAKSSGYGRLDESALVAVKKWKFQPAMRSGSAVEAWVLVPVEFSLTRS